MTASLLMYINLKKTYARGTYFEVQGTAKRPDGFKIKTTQKLKMIKSCLMLIT